MDGLISRIDDDDNDDDNEDDDDEENPYAAVAIWEAIAIIKNNPDICVMVLLRGFLFLKYIIVKFIKSSSRITKSLLVLLPTFN